MPSIELEHLSVNLGGRTILDDLDGPLSGRVIGLLGPNGAGKSTLMQTLLGFYKPHSGTARILGMDIRSDIKDIRHRIGFMPENDAFVSGMSAIRLVRMMGELSGLPRHVALERAHEILFFLGLGEARYRNVETYSLGMKQLAKLAVATVHGPQMLILDEPTNGLDAVARGRMMHGPQMLILDEPTNGLDAVARGRNHPEDSRQRPHSGASVLAPASGRRRMLR